MSNLINSENRAVKVGNFFISNDSPLMMIAGPCMLESREVAFRCAEHLVKVADELNINFIFKSSFDKANRTSLNAKRGVQLEEGLKIFQELKAKFGFPILTDIHEPSQAASVAEVVDVLQIPAFLCRQTDLLVAAAKTGKVVNAKKGQFLAPWDMKNVCAKIVESGNENVIVTERGVCFGYNQLVTDMRALKIMKELEHPVIFDATHSVQEPGGRGDSSGGKREFIEVQARAAVSVGIAGVFLETHFDPNNALSDGQTMVPLHAVKNLVANLQKIDEVAKSYRYIDINC